MKDPDLQESRCRYLGIAQTHRSGCCLGRSTQPATMVQLLVLPLFVLGNASNIHLRFDSSAKPMPSIRSIDMRCNSCALISSLAEVLMQLCKQETTQDWEISCDKHVGRIIQGGFNIYQKSVTEAPPVNWCRNCHKVIRCYEILQ